MTTWTTDELHRIGTADELQLSSRRGDGTLRPPVTIWVVRVDDDLFVRSAYGATNPWFVRAEASGSGHVSAGGVEKDVGFEQVGTGLHESIDAAYHAKYDHYGPKIVGTVVGPDAAPNTLRLVP
ncbi:DUF2255 family protein [Herbiconiux daphne]|uniref:DUF2255 family protein n=1 Tax=Herbiconiux daphne TaxID=2970914 RepID=A0ABT2H2C6_9MICO|nr:DUF2255 family protein [Herbiconiux daphne]MCS5734103.1 DUF2255 family protein [Herbiconiux daphne]